MTSTVFRICCLCVKVHGSKHVSMGCSGYKIMDDQELHVRKPGFRFDYVWEIYGDFDGPQRKPVGSFIQLQEGLLRIS